MHFVLQKDNILIHTVRGFYICSKNNIILNVIAKGDSNPSIIHNYKGKAMLDFKNFKTWRTDLRVEVNPAVITGYTKSSWIYSDTDSENWLPDPNYEYYREFKTFNQSSFRKDIMKEPYRTLN
jgi:hypothetical protein